MAKENNKKRKQRRLRKGFSPLIYLLSMNTINHRSISLPVVATAVLLSVLVMILEQNSTLVSVHKVASCYCKRYKKGVDLSRLSVYPIQIATNWTSGTFIVCLNRWYIASVCCKKQQPYSSHRHFCSYHNEWMTFYTTILCCKPILGWRQKYKIIIIITMYNSNSWPPKTGIFSYLYRQTRYWEHFSLIKNSSKQPVCNTLT